MTERPDIIELIDNAIGDTTSPDAMRWSPDTAECCCGRGAEPTFTIIDETHVWAADEVHRFIAESLGVEVTPWQGSVLRWAMNSTAAPIVSDGTFLSVDRIT